MGEEVEGSGVLILVAGPSGSGKDTLISAARHALADHEGFVFPTRFITRADQTGEEHVYVSPQDFERLRRDKLFFLDWDAHGFGYGIPASVRNDLAMGRAVVFNVSRKLIPAARAIWKKTEVISVFVAPQALRERLKGRGRETDAEMEARVTRASDDACRLTGSVHILDNSGALDRSINEFLALLTLLAHRPVTEPMPAYNLEGAPAIRFAQK